jgi:hypothetical protein
MSNVRVTYDAGHYWITSSSGHPRPGGAVRVRFLHGSVVEPGVAPAAMSNETF